MAQFKPGVSGNPKGRPVGSKNQITLLKESLELALRERSEPRMSAVLDKAFELALEGSESMLKLLLELHMSKGTTQDGSKAAEKVQININGPTPKITKEEVVPLSDSPGRAATADDEVALLLANDGSNTTKGK